jgi:hypothetical protein
MQVEANIGERRITAWSGVGISICPELDVAAVTEQCGGDKEARAVGLATTAYKVSILVNAQSCVCLGGGCLRHQQRSR